MRYVGRLCYICFRRNVTAFLETLVMPARFRQAKHHCLNTTILWNHKTSELISLDEEFDDGISL
jgi:hypothetical protein